MMQVQEAQASHEALRAQAEAVASIAAASRERKLERAASIAAEPAASPTVSHVAVRLRDGRRVNRRFYRDCSLRDVVCW